MSVSVCVCLCERVRVQEYTYQGMCVEVRGQIVLEVSLSFYSVSLRDQSQLVMLVWQMLIPT